MAQSLKLIVAEDSQADMFLIRESLRMAGLQFEADVASDGEKALALVEGRASPAAAPVDGIILDLNLVTHSGLDILRRVRSMPKLAKVRVVILTSSDAPEDRKQADLLGADRYFRKPLELSEFMRMGREIAEVFTEP